MRPLKGGLLCIAGGLAGYAVAPLTGPVLGYVLDVIAFAAIVVGFFWMQRDRLTPRHRRLLLWAMVVGLVASLFARATFDAPNVAAVLVNATAGSLLIATAALATWPIATRRWQQAWFVVVALPLLAAVVQVVQGARGADPVPWAIAGHIVPLLLGAALVARLALRPMAVALTGPQFGAPFLTATPAPRKVAKRKVRVGMAKAAAPAGPSDAERLAALEERFKRGEIDEWTYLDKRQEIEGH